MSKRSKATKKVYLYHTLLYHMCTQCPSISITSCNIVGKFIRNYFAIFIFFEQHFRDAFFIKLKYEGEPCILSWSICVQYSVCMPMYIFFDLSIKYSRCDQKPVVLTCRVCEHHFLNNKLVYLSKWRSIRSGFVHENILVVYRKCVLLKDGYIWNKIQ